MSPVGYFYNDLTWKTEVILSFDTLLKFYLFFVFECSLVFFFFLQQIHSDNIVWHRLNHKIPNLNNLYRLKV